MDFTVATYRELLQALADSGYVFKTFLRFIEEEEERKVTVLRHDVDRLPGNALRFAQLEHALGIPATYYFRIVPQSFDPGIIREISAMGHEIGYHYEDLTLAGGVMERAVKLFGEHLERLRALAPVKTICMHGSPLSKWDNRKLWEQYDYRDHGIVAEPYFDVDYSKVFYITDTGRSWRGSDANVRDKVASGFNLTIRSTPHLAGLAKNGKLPGRIIINTHPQRWNPPGLRWFREFVVQNIKNIGKFIVVRLSSENGGT